MYAIRVRIHTGSRNSPYSLLFGRNPRIPSDENLIRPLEVTKEELDYESLRIENLQHARMIANQRLVEKAIKAQKMREENVKISSFSESDWVLVRAEARNKFEGRWYGPYRVEKTMPLGTYLLADPKGDIVPTLINGQRLVSARVTDKTIKRLWNSSKIQGSLRRRNIQLDESSPEIVELFERESRDTPSYDELASIPKAEWEKLLKERQKRSGDRLEQVEEGNASTPSRSLADEERDLEEGLTEGLVETPTLTPEEEPEYGARSAPERETQELNTAEEAVSDRIRS